MTIDEAQTMLNARAKCIEKVCKGIYKNCNEENCDNCDLCYAQGTNGEQKELMLQCAEWLEELKELRLESSLPKTNETIARHVGYEVGYNKAIDNFANLIKQRKFDYIEQCLEFDDFVDRLAEQLKEGGV